MEKQNIKYSDFFLNIKHIPAKGTEARKILRNREKARCLGGVYIDGVFISGWLYWHINHWWITDDIKDEFGNIQTWERVAPLRDNEWLRADAIEKCKTHPDGQKGYCEVGLRQGAKSTCESSYIGYNATLFKKSQNAVISGSDEDLSNLKLRLNYGLSKIHEIIKIPKLTKDKRAKEIALGYKATDGEDQIWSYIITRNISEGHNTEGPAGLSAKSLVFDEIGKALRYDSLLYMPNKEITIEECKVGDKIYGNDGHLTTIVDKFDSGKVDIFEIKLQDGRKIKASSNHLWKVYNTYNKKYEIKTTIELFDKYYYDKIDKNNKINKSFIYSIANTSGIKYPEKNLEVDPYYLGLWLGDGFSSKPNTVCSEDDFIINSCKEFGKSHKLISTIKYTKKNNSNFRNISLVNKKGKTNILDSLFKELNLVDNKHIPEKYLKASYSQRLDLLKGLMDTDGSCSKLGHIEFSTSFPKLALDFETLCRGLGISIYKKIKKTYYTKNGIKVPCKDSYRFSLYTGIRIFKLQRKLKNYYLSRRNNNSKKQMAYKTRCTITNITPIGIDQAYCIKVNNKSHLFLTDNYTVTHNSSFSQALEAAKPAMMSKYGWRAIPWAVGTGGSFENGEDAERLFYHPEANNFLGFKDEETGETTGFFMSGLFRTDCKYETNLAEYLIKEGKIPQGDYPELSKIPILVSDKEKALKKILEDRKLKAQDPDNTEYLKLIMYFPLTPKECFLSSSDNFYNSDIAQQQKDTLEKQFPGLKVGMFVDLEEEQVTEQSGNVEIIDVKIRHKVSTKLPISSYPTKTNENLDAPIVIFEHPIPNPPVGLYTGGVDPYIFDEAPTSDSIGVVYIYKRAFDIFSNGFQNQIVAYYAARPKSKDEWNKNARLLIEYYNATYVLVENDEMSFINYMNSLNKGHYLMDTPEWLKAEVGYKGANMVRHKGVSRSSLAVRNLLRTNLKQYMEEVYTTVSVEGSNEPRKILGVTRINDPMLLEEIVKWNKDRNADREVAASLAITAARKLDELNIRPDIKNDDPRFQMPVRYKLKDKSGRNIFKAPTYIPTKERSMRLFK